LISEAGANPVSLIFLSKPACSRARAAAGSPMADHADSRTTKLYDRRGQKVLREDVERIRY